MVRKLSTIAMLGVVSHISALQHTCTLKLYNDTGLPVYVTDLKHNVGQLVQQGNTEQRGKKFIKKGRFEIVVGTQKRMKKYQLIAPCTEQKNYRINLSRLDQLAHSKKKNGILIKRK